MTGDGALKTAVGRRLSVVDELDRRSLQGAFMVLVAIDLLIRSMNGDFAWVSFPALGGLIAVLTTVATFAVPWHRAATTALMMLPVLDIVAISLIRLSPLVGGIGAAILVPILWMGGQFGRRGATVCGVSSLVLIGGSTFAYFGLAPSVIPRALLLPLVAWWGAHTIASALERLSDGLAAADRDKSDLARALRIIEHQRRFSEAILDTVDVGLVLLDKNGGYQSMNRRHEDFMRLAFPEGHEGKAGQLGLVYAQDGTTPLTAEEMPSYRASHGEEFDDCRIWCGDDPLTRRALSVSARSVHGVWGEFAGAALAYKDVTEFMRAMMVKDEFVASVSHELRTPLTSISGYVDILRERDDLHPEVAGQLEVVARNTDRLRRLVADLLHTAQVEDGPLHVVRTECDLVEIVSDCVEAAAPLAKVRDIAVETHLVDDLLVVIDRQRMAQVVDNLISNAIKYTPDGGQVCVQLARDADRFELTVTDTGMGIAPLDREQLFTRFFRTRQAEERSIQGVGLGLAITKQIVEAHGGRIEVESELDEGSTFRVRIPL